MPNHRFIDELEKLELYPITGSHNILIVGTFNAENQEGLVNDAEWFYGRYANEFWYLFPQLMGEPSFHRRECHEVPLIELADIWRNFSKLNDITFIDVYKAIEGVLPNHGDDAIANPVHYTPFGYEIAFAQCSFDKVLFTWKGRNQNTILGQIKETMHNWLEERGSTNYHMVSPSYAYPVAKEKKLSTWTAAFNR